jgi:hypothetical protein
LGDDHLDRIHLHDLDGVLSAPYKYQPEVVETFDPEISRWCDYRVAKVHRLPAKQPATQTEPTAGQEAA